jgi:hypothetical protein
MHRPSGVHTASLPPPNYPLTPPSRYLGHVALSMFLSMSLSLSFMSARGQAHGALLHVILACLHDAGIGLDIKGALRDGLPVL